MIKKIVVRNKQVIEPLFEIGKRVMLKDNLLIVEIGDIKIKKHKYYYSVRYPHLEYNDGRGWFNVCENELEEKPYNYDEIIFRKYIEYRHKYEELYERLYSPSNRDIF